jgi:CRISPR-associated protein Csx17
MASEPLSLYGCTPKPLASYLKALGVLRLVSSPANHVSVKAADPHARGWWKNECFHLQTTLSRDALLHFLLHDYAPSPIIAPWNGRAGFLEGDAGEESSRRGAVLIRAVEKADCRRLALMRRTIGSLRTNDQLLEYDRLRALEKRLKSVSKFLKEEEKRLIEAKPTPAAPPEHSNPFHQQIESARAHCDAQSKQVVKKAKAVKSRLLPNLRSETASHHVSYIDACYVLAADEAAAPLLGSGGNDGSRDFGVNFAEMLQKLVDFSDGSPSMRARTELESALLDVVNRSNEHGSMGQFSPGQGGANATTGYKGSNPLNAWDIVLAMEGTMAFAGALTRRWGATSGSRAAFPFTFEPTGAGAGMLSPEDPNRPRGEIWTPLWSKPATLSEVAAIFREGRLTLGERAAQTGLDAARSVARLGAARGLVSFERYSIIQPDSKMPYQATPLGRFSTPDRRRRDLVSELEAGDWLDRVRRVVGNKKKAPARARLAMRRLEDALFQMAAANRESEGTQSALMAMGGLVGWFASSPTGRKGLRPPPLLSSTWIRRADDGSAEFRVAAALAAIGLPIPARPSQRSDPEDPKAAPHAGRGEEEGSSAPPETQPALEPTHQLTQGRQNPAPPMASHLAPVNEETFFYRGSLSGRRQWAAGDAPPTKVWGAGPLVPNLIAVLERRLVEASIRGLMDKPLAGAMAASLADVAAFLSADFDDARCAALLAGLVWARPTRLCSTPQQPTPVAVPFAYAALKPVLTPDAALCAAGVLPATARMPVPAGLLARLRAGGNSSDGRATDAAVRLAMARARASGLPSPFRTGQGNSRGARAGSGRMGAGVPADRLAAALLIPIGARSLATLIKRAYPGAPTAD